MCVRNWLIGRVQLGASSCVTASCQQFNNSHYLNGVVQSAQKMMFVAGHIVSVFGSRFVTCIQLDYVLKLEYSLVNQP